MFYVLIVLTFMESFRRNKKMGMNLKETLSIYLNTVTFHDLRTEC